MSDPSLTFAFVDLAGYTALTEQHGDQDAANCAERFYALAEFSLVGDTRVVKRIGDAVMLVSSEPKYCVATVFALFRAAEAEPLFPALRAGIHAGLAVERCNDYFGATVNLAARIGAYARSGEVLSGNLAATEAERDGVCRAVFLGAVVLKNLPHPVEIWSLIAAVTPRSPACVIDPVCRMHVDTPRVTIEHDGCRYAFCSDACAERFRAEPTTFISEYVQREKTHLPADKRKAIDVVCNMEVDQDTTKWSLIWNQQPLYFCTERCMIEFRRHPEEYIDQPSGPDKEHKHS